MVRNGWSVHKTVVTMLVVIVIGLLSYIYGENNYLFSEEVRWADLSYSVDRVAWQEEVPTDSIFWVRGKLLVSDTVNDYNGVFIGLAGDYQVYWDSLWVGENGTSSEHGAINYYQPLDSAQLTLGAHTIELHVVPSRLFFSDRLYAGVIMGNVQRFGREPLVQFVCIGVIIGLLVVIWGTLYLREWPAEVLWLIMATIGYLLLNFTKVYYNYAVDLHDWRLLAYGFSNVLLSLALINYTLGQIGFRRLQWLMLPLSLLISAVFWFPEYDSIRQYVLIGGQVISLSLLFFNIAKIKVSFLLVTHLYLLVMVQFETGLLLMVGYVVLPLLEYIESILPKPVVLSVKEPPEHLIASFGGGKKVVLLSEVVAIKGANNYTELILMNQERYLCDQSMKQISEMMPDYYLRVHKSFIVDLRKVDTIHTNRAGGKVLTMKNQLQLPVGRAYKHDLVDRLNHRI